MPELHRLGCGKYYNGFNKSTYYTNEDAVEKVIRYITRTRYYDDRSKELIAYGGAGISCEYGVPYIIKQFIQTQKLYDIDRRQGSRLYHEVLMFSDEEMNKLIVHDFRFVIGIAREICRYYFDSGFEAVYAIHYDLDKHLHIHIVVNAISFIDGRQYIYKNDKNYKKEYFDRISKKYSDMAERLKRGLIKPLIFIQQGGYANG